MMVNGPSTPVSHRSTMRDFDVRQAVLKSLRAEHSHDANTRIVEEMGIWSGSVRIDVAVINGELHGFELKSDRDTLARLESQAELYNQVFDRVTLVVGERHLDKAVSKIPDWWGVTRAALLSGELTLRETKRANLNPNVEPISVGSFVMASGSFSNSRKAWFEPGIQKPHSRYNSRAPCRSTFPRRTFVGSSRNAKIAFWLVRASG